MATVVASRSGQLARPGAHVDDLEEADAPTPDTNRRDAPATTLGGPTDLNDESAREIQWACEWWPPI